MGDYDNHVLAIDVPWQFMTLCHSHDQRFDQLHNCSKWRPKSASVTIKDMRNHAEVALTASTNLPVTFNNICFSDYDQIDPNLLWKRAPYINDKDYQKWKEAVSSKDAGNLKLPKATEIPRSVIGSDYNPDYKNGQQDDYTWWAPNIYMDTHWIDKYMDVGEVFNFDWYATGGPWKSPTELFPIHAKW